MPEHPLLLNEAQQKEGVISLHHYPLTKNVSSLLAPELLSTPLHNGACLVIGGTEKEEKEEALKGEANMK